MVELILLLLLLLLPVALPPPPSSPPPSSHPPPSASFPSSSSFPSSPFSVSLLCSQTIHEAVRVPLSILRALYEHVGKDKEKLLEEVQRSYDGSSFRTDDVIKDLAQKWSVVKWVDSETMQFCEIPKEWRLFETETRSILEFCLTDSDIWGWRQISEITLLIEYV